MSEFQYQTTLPLELIEPDKTFTNGQNLEVFEYHFDSKRHKEDVIQLIMEYKKLLRMNINMKRKNKIQPQTSRRGAFGADREL